MTGPMHLPRPMPGFRPRTPPPPLPSSPRSRRIPPAESSRVRDIWIPVSDGSYVTENADTCVVRIGLTGSISVTRDNEGRRVVKEEPGLPPFKSLLRPGGSTGDRTPPPRPPPPRWVSPRPNPPATPVPQDPPPPYQGIVVTETPMDLPPPYGEVLVEQLPIGVRGN